MKNKAPIKRLLSIAAIAVFGTFGLILQSAVPSRSDGYKVRNTKLAIIVFKISGAGYAIIKGKKFASEVFKLTPEQIKHSHFFYAYLGCNRDWKKREGQALDWPLEVADIPTLRLPLPQAGEREPSKGYWFRLGCREQKEAAIIEIRPKEGSVKVVSVIKNYSLHEPPAPPSFHDRMRLPAEKSGRPGREP